jgi:hypothetical protein
MVQHVSSGSQVGVVAVAAVRYAQADGPSAVLPVRRAELLYANFRHIQVRPDTRLEDGIPLYKLKILDALIDSFARVSGEPGGARGSIGAGKKPTPSADTIDRVISAVAKNLRSESSGSAAYRAGFLPAPGAFVDLAA